MREAPWSAVACCRFPSGQLAGRAASSEGAGRASPKAQILGFSTFAFSAAVTSSRVSVTSVSIGYGDKTTSRNSFGAQSSAAKLALPAFEWVSGRTRRSRFRVKVHLALRDPGALPPAIVLIPYGDRAGSNMIFKSENESRRRAARVM